MASLKIRRGKYYARIVWRDRFNKQKEKQIALRTESKVTARDRIAIVEKYQEDVKTGIDFTFPWLNNKGETAVKHLTIAEARNEFINTRRGDGLEERTLKRNCNSFKALIRIVGESYPVERITIDTIEKFKAEYQDVHTKEGININLRLIKTFLNWCEVKGYIGIAPKYKLVKVVESLPSYLTDGEFAAIMALDELSPFYKQLFIFHRETGLRLSEPYHGKLEGRWLVIEAKAMKQKREHEVELSDELIHIWRLMISRYDAWISKGRKPDNFPLKVSKMFLWACRLAKVENHHFHDLRHTFAVRMYLTTSDIYKVKQLMGHSSVITTEKYARFKMRRLKSDFPSLQPFFKEDQQRIEMPKVGYVDTLCMDTEVVPSSV